MHVTMIWNFIQDQILGIKWLIELIGYVKDYEKISAYGVMTTPALVVDGKVVSYGKVLIKNEVIEILRKVRN